MYTGKASAKIKQQFYQDVGFIDKWDSKMDLNGIVIGAKIGVSIDINDASAVDFGFKIDKTNYKTITVEQGQQVKFKLQRKFRENNFGPYLGYSYKF